MRLRQIAKGTWTILAYETERGECLVLDFIGTLDKSMQRKIWAEIKITAERGPRRHNTRKCRKFQGYDNLFELKSGTKHGIEARIGFFYDKGKVIVCSHGFTKAETTSKVEIEKIQDVRDQYLSDKHKSYILINDLQVG